MKAKAKRSSAQGTPRKEAEKRQRKADEKNAAAASRERRRLDRRNTDDRVDRLLAQKLYPRFPRELIEGTIAEDGSTPRSMIAEEVRRSKTTNNYLKQEFWTQFFLKFPFEDGLACVVPEPLGNAEIRPEVLEAIAPLHCGNPASRTAINLVTYLESAVDLNERELYGIAMAAQQSCTVTKDMHRRSMSAFLRYTQRTCANERYPRLFDPLLPVLSHLLMEMFSERRKLPPPNWIRTHFDEISLYMDRTHLKECVDAMQRGEQPSDAALEGVLSTPLGAHLFFCFRDKKLMGDFIRSVTKRLDDLVHMDFAEDEVKAFRSVMEKEAAPLQSTVLGPYTVVKHEVTFLGCELNVEMRGTLGVWSKHFSARVKDIGIQTRQCPLLPWEELLYCDAEVPGAPQTITLPADLLSKIRNVRDAARAMFGSGTLTLIEMQRTMNANQRELLECDEHFDLELNFLNNKADALISTRLRQTVMDALPSEKHHVTLASAVAVIDKIDQGPVCAAGNAPARGQVAGILNMLRNFADGRPIDSKLLNTADPFFAACHCRMVYFATTYYDSISRTTGTAREHTRRWWVRPR